jgi:hypothetical protein
MMLPVFIVLPWLPLPRRFIAISLACLVFVRKGHDSERLTKGGTLAYQQVPSEGIHLRNRGIET